MNDMLLSMPDDNAGDRADVGADIVDAFQRLLRQFGAEVEGLDRDVLGWRPAPDTTAISNLVLHVIGAMKVGFTVLCGEPQERDRAAEFEARPLSAAELTARISAAELDLEQFRDWLSVTDLLATRHRPARNFRASGLTVLLITWGHATEHLAQVRLTRQIYDDRCARAAG